MPKNFLTGTVNAPGFFMSTLTTQEIDTSKSVAVSSNFPSSPRSKTFDRMGRVVRDPTIFWTACNPFNSSSLGIVNFICPLILLVCEEKKAFLLKGVHKG